MSALNKKELDEEGWRADLSDAKQDLEMWERFGTEWWFEKDIEETNHHLRELGYDVASPPPEFEELQVEEGTIDIDALEKACKEAYGESSGEAAASSTVGAASSAAGAAGS